MSIKLDEKSLSQYIDHVFDKGIDSTFYDIVKRVEEERPLPKFKEAYFEFYPFDPEL